ncbi:Stressosome protein rsbRA [Sphingobacterium multivorum]|nr:Stressosome protein rsbRA [Sphingobacterium multivorum]
MEQSLGYNLDKYNLINGNKFDNHNINMEYIKQLKNNKSQILESWLKKQSDEKIAAGISFDEEETKEYSEQVVNLLIDSIDGDNLDIVNSPDFYTLIELLKDVSFSRARQGFTPRETGNFVYTLKEAILEILVTEGDQQPLHFFIALSRIMDNLAIHTFETFIKGREDVILRQTDEISEISTPVIKVWDGILALPIIGTLDSARTQTVLENLLEKIVETESSIAILDISGVPAVDSLVAQHLLKAVSATRLMGADCIISGIRPEIAQTIVHLGIDLSQIVTKATLASALKHALRITNIELKANQKK